MDKQFIHFLVRIKPYVVYAHGRRQPEKAKNLTQYEKNKTMLNACLKAKIILLKGCFLPIEVGEISFKEASKQTLNPEMKIAMLQSLQSLVSQTSLFGLSDVVIVGLI